MANLAVPVPNIGRRVSLLSSTVRPVRAVYDVKALYSGSIVSVALVSAQQSLSFSKMVKDRYSGLESFCLTSDPMELETELSRI